MRNGPRMLPPARHLTPISNQERSMPDTSLSQHHRLSQRTVPVALAVAKGRLTEALEAPRYGCMRDQLLVTAAAALVEAEMYLCAELALECRGEGNSDHQIEL